MERVECGPGVESGVVADESVPDGENEPLEKHRGRHESIRRDVFVQICVLLQRPRRVGLLHQTVNQDGKRRIKYVIHHQEDRVEEGL